MANVIVDDALLTAAQKAVGEADARRVIERALRELADRHPLDAAPADDAARRELIEGVIAMGGSEPDLVAPPRRRLW